jgi:predicted deacylase
MGTPYYLVSPFEYHKGRLIGEACNAGIPSIILEAGRGLGSYETEDVKSCMRGIYNLLKWLKMTKGTLDIPFKLKREEFKIHRIVAKHGGLLFLQCKCGDFVTQGQRLGEVMNLQGEIVQKLIAPISGMIHYIFPWHLKRPGQFILGIRRILEDNPNT